MAGKNAELKKGELATFLNRHLQERQAKKSGGKDTSERRTVW